MDNYPPGAANDPFAPYNEIDIPEEEFSVCISQTLSKSVEVTTSDYIPKIDYDEDSGYQINYADTSETNWEEAYKAEHTTLLDLLNVLKEYIDKDIASSNDKHHIRKLKELRQECDGWVEDECEYVQE